MSRSNVKPVSPAAKAVGLMRVLTSTRIGLTAAMLRERIPEYRGLSDAAFERAFERDKSRLRALGLELTVERLEADGLGEVRYRIDLPAHRLPELHLSETERLVTSLAAAAVGGSSWGSHARRASARLVGGASDRLSGRETSGLGARVELSNPPEGAEALILAALCEYPVAFDYRAANGELTERRIMPWGVGQKSGRWYMFGGDIERGGERMFRLDRVQGHVAQANARKTEMVHEIYGRPDKFSMRQELGRLSEREPRHTVLIAVAEGTGAEMKARGRSVAYGGGVEVIEIQGVYPDVVRECAAIGAAVVDAEADIGVPELDVTETDQPERAALEDVEALIEAAIAANADPTGADAAVPRLRVSAGGRPSTDHVLADVVSLVAVIQGEGITGLEDLAHRFGVRVSEIQRRVATLELGAQLTEDAAGSQENFALSIENGNVELTGGDALRYQLNVSLQEATALLLGCQLLVSIPGIAPTVHAAAQTVMHKLMQAREQLGAFDKVVAIEAGETSDATAGFAQKLGQAIADRRTVELEYAGLDATTERSIDPLTLIRVDDKLYVRAWCHLRSDERTFLLERIVHMNITEREATHTPVRPYGVQARGTQEQGEGIDALVVFGPNAEWMAPAFRPSATKRTEHELIGRIEVISAEWVARSVAAAGGDMRIIAPTQLRHDVRLALEGLLDRSRKCRTVGTELIRGVTGCAH